MTPSDESKFATAVHLSPWLTVPEAAERAKCGDRLIRREIREGRLRAARIGNRRDIRIRYDWVDEWLDESARPREVTR